MNIMLWLALFAAPALSWQPRARAAPFARRSVARPMGGDWNSRDGWGICKVLKNEPAGEGLRALTLEAGDPALFAPYAVGGQFVQLAETADSKPAFIALASPPAEGAPTHDILVKATENNAWLADASAGGELCMSPAMGKGFPLAAAAAAAADASAPLESVLLFAAGSGVAPLRAVIESGALPCGATLYYGARDEPFLAYADRFGAWEEERGVKVVPVLSQPSGDAWGGRRGYVQDALKADGVPSPANSAALLCGMKPMAEAVTAALTEAGVPAEGRILTNF